MKIFVSLALFMSMTCCVMLAQRSIPATDFLSICGKIKNKKTFNLAELDTFPKIKITDIIITNHKGEIKDTLKELKGIPLYSLLKNIEYKCLKPKELNEFYFVFIASDAYKVVFSWNEIYNSPMSKSFYIISEMEGESIKNLKDRIMFIASEDINSGRRFIKGLKMIQVKRI